ncbi:hypothetical protein ABZ061_20545 [Streptomyces mutabilis]
MSAAPEGEDLLDPAEPGVRTRKIVEPLTDRITALDQSVGQETA